MPAIQGVSGFANGVRAVFSGLRAILGDGALQRLTILPLMITTVLYVAIFAAGYMLSDDVLALLWARPEEGAMLILWYVVQVVVLIAFVAILIVSFVGAANVVAGPFYERLADRILEAHRVPRKPAPLVLNILREIAWSLTFTIPAAICGLLSLLPGVGIGFAVVAAMVAGLGLAGAAIGPALSATGRGYFERLGFFRRGFGMLAGVALVMSVAIFVPLLGLIAIPSAIVGITEVLAKNGALAA